SDSKARAERVAEQYFEALRADHLDDALALLGAGFYRVTPRDKIISILRDLHSKCGAEKSHSLTAWRATAGFGSSSSNAVLEYDLAYGSCTTHETLTVQEDADGSWKILALNVALTSELSGRQIPATTST